MNKINDIPGKSPFRIPENYFEEVNRKIISSTSGYDKQIEKQGFIRRMRYHLLIAASVAGFIILAYTAFSILHPVGEKTVTADVLRESFSDSFIDELDLMSLEESASEMVLAEDVPDVNSKDIIEYLILENIEISDIYEQL
jgi:hypothetical protein